MGDAKVKVLESLTVAIPLSLNFTSAVFAQILMLFVLLFNFGKLPFNTIKYIEIYIFITNFLNQFLNKIKIKSIDCLIFPI